MLARVDQFQPAFLSLEPVPGTELRWVDGTMVSSEQFHAEGWHVVDVYEGPDGKPAWSWMVEVEGLRSYCRLTAQRRADARAAALRRTEEDGSFRAYVDAIDDARPGR